MKIKMAMLNEAKRVKTLDQQEIPFHLNLATEN
jgi:hypothetical protein